MIPQQFPDPNFKQNPDGWIMRNPVTFLGVIAFSLIIIYFGFAIVVGGCAMLTMGSAMSGAASMGSQMEKQLSKQPAFRFPSQVPATGTYGTPQQTSPQPQDPTTNQPQMQQDNGTTSQPGTNTNQQQNDSGTTPQPLIP
jgi:hypothetical protein